MIMDEFLEFFLFGYGIILFGLPIAFNKKREKRDTRYFWGNKLQEKTRLKISNVMNIFSWEFSIGTIFSATAFYLILVSWNVIDWNQINISLPIDMGREIMVADLAAISAFSLVASLKKKIYFGISIQDILKNSNLPEIMYIICNYSIIILSGIILYRIKFQDLELKSLIVIATKITYFMWIFGLLYLFMEITSLFVGTTKWELKTYNVLRYRINETYRIEDVSLIDKKQIKAICEYLLDKIQKNYFKIAGRDKDIKEVEIQSVKKIDNSLIAISSDVFMFILGLLFIVLAGMMRAYGDKKIPIIVAIVEIIIGAVLFAYGCYRNIWAEILEGRFYYILGEKKQIAVQGINPIWRRRYNLIGNIQDLMGLYKVILDNNIQDNIGDMISQTINEDISSKKLRNVLLILISYLEYEKNGKISYGNRVNKSSLEYTFANAILSEIYKQAKREKNHLNYEKLENVKFDEMIARINK